MKDETALPGRPATALDTAQPSGFGGERLLNATQLADLLGFSPSTIVDWAERDELPHFKIGGRLRFRPSEVAAWLEQRRGTA